MIIIGIAGKARSGKDTTAQYLRDTPQFEPMSFAAPIKHAIQQMFNLNERHMNGDLKEVKLPFINKSPRELFQTLGTEWGRELIHPELWLHVASITVQQLQQTYLAQGTNLPGIVFSDIRFNNEAAWIRKQGGRIIHLLRDDAPQVAEHCSENGVTHFKGDYLIHNNSSLFDLYNTIDSVICDIKNTNKEESE
jgi:hypothetical protein